MVERAARLGGLLVAAAVLSVIAAPISAGQAEAPFELVAIPAGSFEAGDPDGRPDEAPRPVTVAPLQLMRFEVTNAQFAAFVDETGHVTDPERRRLRLCLARALDQGAGRRLAASQRAGLGPDRPRRPPGRSGELE